MTVTLLVVLLLLNCVVVGTGLSYLSGVDLRFEERLAYGACFGLIVFTLVGWIVTRLSSFSGSAVTVAALISLGLSGIGFFVGRGSIRPDIADLGNRFRQPLSAPGNPLPLVAFLIPAWIVAIRILRLAYRTSASGGIEAGHLATFSDWQAHHGYVSSFVYANNTNLDLPFASGYELTYHAGINYFAALLVPAGASVTSALTISAGFCAFAFAAVMYLVGQRIFKSRAVALLGSLIFFMFGGWGWGRFLRQVWDEGPGILAHLPITYTRDPANGWWIENSVIGHLFPQRPTLIGFPVVMIVCGLLWTARERRSARIFAFAGVVVGLMPWFNLFAFGVPLAMGGAWALMDGWSRFRATAPNRVAADADSGDLDADIDEEVGSLTLTERLPMEWLWYFTPLLVLSIPVVSYLLPPSAEGGQAADWWYMWVPEQLFGADNSVFGTLPEGEGAGTLSFRRLLSLDVAWFWIKNFGLFLPLLLIAHLWKGAMPRAIAWASIPIWAWFIIPNFVKPHPWSGNNIHYFIFVVLLGAFPVAAVLVHFLKTTADASGVESISSLYTVGLVVATLTFAGALDIWSAADASTGVAGADGPALLMDRGDIAVAEWVRDNTGDDAVFVTASNHQHPVPALGGRTVVAGFSGWIFDLNVPDWGTRTDHSNRILQGTEEHQALIEQYGVDYVVIGPAERNQVGANQQFWDTSGNPVVYDFAGYRIYEVAT